MKILGFYVIIKVTNIHCLVVSLGGLKLKKQKRYNVGIYCRLSKDDMGGGESTSIVSQKNMLEKYVKDNGWTVFGCYIDDYAIIGLSGRNLDISRGLELGPIIFLPSFFIISFKSQNL